MSRKARKEMTEARKTRENSAFILSHAFETLNALPNGAARERLLDMLRMYVINNNCSLIVTPERPIAREHKLLIRDDCNGNISNIVTEYLSPSYLQALKVREEGMFFIKDYSEAFQKSVFQREMTDYPSYKSIENTVLNNLISHKISPNIIKNMNISDFRDFVKEFCYDDFTKYREKNGFVKVFIRENEYQFYHLLRDNGVHPAYVDALIANMHEKGSADEFKLEYKGQLITGPGFDIDHKNPVYCPDDISMYPEVNYPRSLAIVEKNAHRMKHKLERMIVSEDGGKRFEKILLPQYCAAVLDFENFLVHDFENPERHVSLPRPRADNLIYLNKIDSFVNSPAVVNEIARCKMLKSYANKRDGRK